MGTILCTGADPVLLRTRKLVLEQAGHKVVIAVHATEIQDVCSRQNFHVAVLGATVPQVLKQTFKIVKKNCPSARILEICFPAGAKVLSDADGWLEMLDTPTALVELVNALARSEILGRSVSK